jgi:hypothetical protein
MYHLSKQMAPAKVLLFPLLTRLPPKAHNEEQNLYPQPPHLPLTLPIRSASINIEVN